MAPRGRCLFRARCRRGIPRTTRCTRCISRRSPACRAEARGAREGGRRAVLVLPQWNAGPDGHVGLCRLLNRFGMSALRLTLPYHDARRPPELNRADYIVSANVGRTVQACRQAVMDARRAIGWLASQGYDRIGILGTSLGSCLSLLTAAHEPRVRAQALNHISPYFADVVWRGLSTTHVRAGLEGSVELDRLRADVAADQPAGLPRSDQEHEDAARLREVRPDISRRSVAGARRRVQPRGRFHTSWRCCRAGTTRPASRRSSFSMGLCWRGFWIGICSVKSLTRFTEQRVRPL